MKWTIKVVLFVLAISMFCGIIGISIGAGSVFTQVNQIAGPLVCGNQPLKLVQHVYSYKPGSTSWSITAYCGDSKQDVSNWVQLVAGAIYGLGFFALALIVIAFFYFKNRGKEPEKAAPEPPRPSYGLPPAPRGEKSAGVNEKLRKLKELHDGNLITDEDYEKKKAEILEEL